MAEPMIRIEPLPPDKNAEQFGQTRRYLLLLICAGRGLFEREEHEEGEVVEDE